eukprot:COSAG06_NODE_751_length_12582_cov_40.259072_5_plen_93_part_00
MIRPWMLPCVSRSHSVSLSLSVCVSLSLRMCCVVLCCVIMIIMIMIIITTVLLSDPINNANGLHHRHCIVGSAQVLQAQLTYPIALLIDNAA